MNKSKKSGENKREDITKELKQRCEDLTNEVKQKETMLLEDIVDAIFQTEDNGEFGDLCLLFIEQLCQSYKNNIEVYVPVIKEDPYNGEYLVKIGENEFVSKELKESDNRKFLQAYTSKELVEECKGYVNYGLQEIVTDALLEKDIDALLIDNFEVDRKLLGYLKGIEYNGQ